ncbi:LysR family transcriptional regulator [Aerococcaceae bacterium DSM 111022]|nr:LysR family transcriptional regulator [Aerococcaceae bacterium DSM 111022]
MELAQMYYLLKIVENDYNLSLTSRRLHISQPALSQFINQYEDQNGIDLFVREKGRYVGLTDAGQKIYNYALEIINMYEDMESAVEQESLKQKGVIRLGLPSLILSVYFSKLFPDMVNDNPNLNLKLVEAGSRDLKDWLAADHLDLAILIEPTELDADKYEQNIIQLDEYVAFMAKDHPLVNYEKLEWTDLIGYTLATFNENYYTHELVNAKLKHVGLQNHIRITASAWDYLIEILEGTDIITILPRPIEERIDKTKVTTKQFYDEIPFNFDLCRPIKKKYSPIESEIHQNILENFYKPNA